MQALGEMGDERRGLVELGVVWRIILKFVMQKQNGRLRAEFT
jgi:hypothetical protein